MGTAGYTSHRCGRTGSPILTVVDVQGALFSPWYTQGGYTPRYTQGGYTPRYTHREACWSITPQGGMLVYYPSGRLVMRLKPTSGRLVMRLKPTSGKHAGLCTPLREACWAMYPSQGG